MTTDETGGGRPGRPMTGPLLATKLHVPNRREGRIARPRLGQLLSAGEAATVVVVSAPAGFGKTTAVTEWLDAQATQAAVAWVSLDERDNDPVTFWAYVVAALSAHLGGDLAGERDSVVTALLNELALVDRNVILVLDDYHVIEHEEIHRGVGLLCERLPPRARVVIVGRADPALPLGRLRVGGRLAEVRAHDLRFSDEEAAAYLAGRVGQAGPPLSAADVAALAERTEGWAAALQLAALSISGRPDASSFIASFAGDDRYIVDYLVEEVLDRQSDDVRQFLLGTSILDRLTGPLCDAVTGQGGGRSMLDRLERANLFLVPLDDRRQWYRYHHLFADVLQAHLADGQPEMVAALHRRASAWFAANGDPSAAVRHAFAAGDPALAAGLVEAAVPTWRRDRQEATILRWLQLLPPDVIGRRPVLLIDLIGARAAVGGFAPDTDQQLNDVERLLTVLAADPNALEPGGPIVVIRREQLPSLPAAIEMYRAGLALSGSDLDGTRRHGRLALDVVPGDDHLVRAAAAALVGLAAWAGGDVQAACDGYATSIDGLRRAGHLADVLGCSIALADLLLAQGRLHDAQAVYSEGLRLGSDREGAPLRGTADMHIGLAEIHCERGELDAARHHLGRSTELGEHNGLPQHPYRWRLALARLRVAEGDVDAAWPLLDEAAAVYATDFSPSIRPIPAVRAALQAEHGRLAMALAWAGERGIGAGDDVGYLDEYEHVVLARILLAQFRADRSAASLDNAIGLLQRLAGAAEAGGRHGDLLRIQLLQALAFDAQGRRGAAVACVERAVRTAEPEGYLRLFADEGPRLRPLLEAVAARGTAVGYVRHVLAGGLAPAPRPRSERQGLVDPLSEREMDVLRLLASELSGPEIARELTVSVNTVRTHTKAIFAKLGVSNRRAAVRRAGELHLLVHRPAS